MNPMQYIRKHVFRVTQSEMAEIADAGQASVSRWENGSGSPDRDEMERIRMEAFHRGLEWDDRLFFEAPSAEEAAQ